MNVRKHKSGNGSIDRGQRDDIPQWHNGNDSGETSAELHNDGSIDRCP